MEDQSWWAANQSWIIPLLTLLIAQGVILILFIARQRAEDRRRWYERRLDAYAKFIGQYRTLRRLKPDRRLWLAAVMGTAEEFREAMVEASRETSESDLLRAEEDNWADNRFEVSLLGSEPVRDAADAVFAAYFELVHGVSEGVLAEEWSESVSRVQLRVREFEKAVREELRIT